MEKCKLNIEKHVVIVCECGVKIDKVVSGYRNGEVTCRKSGWSRVKRGDSLDWLCPSCMSHRKLTQKIKSKTFRGRFVMNGKLHVKTANGIFEVGKARDGKENKED